MLRCLSRSHCWSRRFAGDYRAIYALPDQVSATADLTLHEIENGLFAVTEKRAFWRAEDVADVSVWEDATTQPNRRPRARDASDGWAVLRDGMLMIFLQAQTYPQASAYAAVIAGKRLELEAGRFRVLCVLRLENSISTDTADYEAYRTSLIDTAIKPNLIQFVSRVTTQTESSDGA